jgi:hypothetical protein
VCFDQRGVAEQIEQRIRRALDLKQFRIGDRAVRADDGVRRAGHYRRIRVGRTQARAQLAGKAIMQALEAGFLGLRQVEIGEHPPTGNRQIPDQGLLDLAEPADEPGYRRPRNPVGQQEIKVLLLGQARDQALYCHESVIRIR